MATKKPKFTKVKQVQKTLVSGVFVPAKELRKVIDIENIATQKLVAFPKEFQEKYDKLVEVYEKYAKQYGEDSTKTIDLAEEDGLRDLGLEGRVQVNTIGRFVAGKSNFQQSKYLVNKLFPDIKKSNDLGHKNLSVLRANMALALDGMELSDPRRANIRALYVLLEELDKITDENDIGNVNIYYLLDQLEEAVSQERDVTLAFSRDVDILKGKANAVLELEYEPIGLNRAKGNVAAFIGTVFRSVIRKEENDILNFLDSIDVTALRGSPDMVEDILDSLVEAIDPKKTPKTRKRNQSVKSKIPGASKKRHKKPKTKQPRIAASSTSAASVPFQALIGIFNEQLPQVVAKNMGEPRLNFRTGRLANSVRVTDAIATRRGFPSFGYTYMKSPYQTFEPGFRQGSPDRDPRKLIDASMREIAAQYAIGRFYTRRQ
jgi:hypothetical protein